MGNLIGTGLKGRHHVLVPEKLLDLFRLGLKKA